jgi:hypothetical protein
MHFAADADKPAVADGVDRTLRRDLQIDRRMFTRDDQIAAVVVIKIGEELRHEVVTAFLIDLLVHGPGKAIDGNPIDVGGVGDGVCDRGIARRHPIQGAVRFDVIELQAFGP